MTHASITGAIIAGGRSSRFGNINKARAILGGKPLLEHVYDRLTPQVDHLYINCHKNYFETTRIDSPNIVDDFVPGQKGPLNGVLGCLDACVKDGFEWLLIAPCDTPFLPMDLASRLMDAVIKRQVELVIPVYKGIPQASLSLWHASLLEPLRKSVVEQGSEGFKQFYPHSLHELLEWPQETYDPFININHQGDLTEAADIINQLGIKTPD
jgi:molybdopterin-guanine dinucleotide biosynthesis protein A